MIITALKVMVFVISIGCIQMSLEAFQQVVALLMWLFGCLYAVSLALVVSLYVKNRFARTKLGPTYQSAAAFERVMRWGFMLLIVLLLLTYWFRRQP